MPSLDRHLAAMEELERHCAASALPGNIVEQIGRLMTKWYRANAVLLIGKLARECRRDDADPRDAVDRMYLELGRGRIRWRQRLAFGSPVLPPDLDEIQKLVFLLLRIEKRAGKLPLSLRHLHRSLGPGFAKSLIGKDDLRQIRRGNDQNQRASSVQARKGHR